MKQFLLSALFFLCLFCSQLSAKIDITQIKPEEKHDFPTDENLTKSVGGFVEANWKQAGYGFNLRNVILEQNFSFNALPKNYKRHRTMEYVTLHNGEIVKSFTTLNEYKLGWVFDLSSSWYPYAAGGILIKTKMHEIHVDGMKNFTLKYGQSSTGTGEIGVFYLAGKLLMFKGSLQINPLMPFLGFGLNLGQGFADFRNE
jgi:hypothetical protein